MTQAKYIGMISARLSALRLSKGWTLEEASVATDGLLSRSRISNYEQGLRKMGIPEAKLLAKAYATTAAHLLCLDEDSPVLSKHEQKHINNLRALPEKDREEYIQRVATLAMAYKVPVADEREPKRRKTTKTTKRKEARPK